MIRLGGERCHCGSCKKEDWQREMGDGKQSGAGEK